MQHLPFIISSDSCFNLAKAVIHQAYVLVSKLDVFTEEEIMRYIRQDP